MPVTLSILIILPECIAQQETLFKEQALSIYLSGSVAYDRIMNFPGRFTDSILPDQIHNLNVSFFIDRLDEKLGGNAGNIAYSLYLLGLPSIVVATVGKDFDKYHEVFADRGLSLEGISRLDTELTASAYITTDQTNNQITAFHAAAMMTPSTYTFPNLNPEKDLALIGPSNLTDMRAHPKLYKEKGVRYIYDPAQQLPVHTADDLRISIQGAFLLIGNDYEIQLIMNMTGMTRAELLGLTTHGIISTMGEKGSLVIDKNGAETHVAAVSVKEVKDPTGAGDAYRSGLLYGLSKGKGLAASAKIGATCSAYCIEHAGTQGHSYTHEEFVRRHTAAFGEAL